MTAAQKTAKANFKKAIEYRKKTGCTLKQAFAHVYGKKVGAVKKKAAPKRKAAVKKAAPKRKVAVKKAAPKRKVAVKKANRQTETSVRKFDILHQAKPVGKRTTKNPHKYRGKTIRKSTTYTERRANRSDKGKLLGIKIGSIPTYTDKNAAREIQLFADNDYQLYNQRRRPILINLGKKYKKGTYDVQKAAKLWRYYIDAAMQKYNKDFGSRGDKWFELLSVPDRNLLALEYAMETKYEFDLGNFTS